MKKKTLFVLLVIVGVFIISGCGSNNQSSSGTSYNLNGIDVKLDKEEERDGMNYKTSSYFTKDYKSSTSTYIIYKDINGDKYDLSNIVFRLDVNVDIMNSESKINREKELVLRKDTFENVEQSQKTINDITWEYFSFDNTTDKENSFKEHIFITERKVNNYYYVYKIYFSYAENINEFEEEFMKEISFK